MSPFSAPLALEPTNVVKWIVVSQWPQWISFGNRYLSAVVNLPDRVVTRLFVRVRVLTRDCANVFVCVGIIIYRGTYPANAPGNEMIIYTGIASLLYFLFPFSPTNARKQWVGATAEMS